MRENTKAPIFARTDAASFVGREVQLERLLSKGSGESGPGGFALLSAPGAGTSELLRQVYDRLFTSEQDVIPFYFEIKASDRTAQNAALRFLCEFLLQSVAFRRGDPNIIAASPAMGEIAELAAPADGYWIDRLVASFLGDPDVNGERSFVRNCLSAPLRAAANGSRSFVMIDDLQMSDSLAGGEGFIEDLTDIFSRSSIPFAFAGLRRFLYARTPFETMAVEPFTFSEAGRFAENTAVRTRVSINDQTRDLMAVQLGGRPGQIASLFASAAANGTDLNSFEYVEQAYTDEIFGGRIGRDLDAVFDRVLPDAAVQMNVLRLLSETLAAAGRKLPVQYWKKHMGRRDAEFDAILDGMNYNELVSVGSGFVEVDETNLVLCDYINGRSRLEIDSDNRALTVGKALSANVKRAPALMGRYYRRTSAIGLRSLLKSFDGREISPALIDYGRFRDKFKGAAGSDILKAFNEDAERIRLPRIIYTAHTAAFYPRLNEVCDTERSAVALGFVETAEKDEVVWIAAEIDSKLEAETELAEFWCDRLEMVAVSCNFSQYKLWLVAPEGFAPDAMKVLQERNAYGSSRKQVDLMIGLLRSDMPLAETNAASEYEIVVPMGEDTEMIAAHTVEEIAKRHNFPAKAINQIKTALVEACINAAEHSLSPDRKIYQKFAVDNEKLSITVANRGLRMTDNNAREVASDTGRRGWGLKLIKGLMDEVKLERTDDGTRITMIKYRSPDRGQNRER